MLTKKSLGKKRRSTINNAQKRDYDLRWEKKPNPTVYIIKQKGVLIE